MDPFKKHSLHLSGIFWHSWLVKAHSCTIVHSHAKSNIFADLMGIPFISAYLWCILDSLESATSERWQVVGVSWALRGRSIRNCWHKFPLEHALDRTQSVRDTKAKIHLTSAHHFFTAKVWSLFLLHSNYVWLSLRISFIFPLIVNRADSHKINITIGGRLNSSIFNFLPSYTKLPELSLFSIQDLGNLRIGIFFPQVKVF